MFCYQCEQTAQGKGCTVKGVCGKEGTTAALQDLVIHAMKGLGQVAHAARAKGVSDPETDRFSCHALFATLTNVNFDDARFVSILQEIASRRDRLIEKSGASPGDFGEAASWKPASDLQGLIAQGQAVSIPSRRDALGEDVTSLQELLTYGLKGLAAYAFHAADLGKEDDGIYGFVYEALDALGRDLSDADALTALNLKCGEVNVKAMEILDAGHTETFGHPEPTAVRVDPVKGKAILVSGHDLRDLKALLEQTEGKGVNVYTHGEMLPANAYPELKKHAHLAGNYGGAWQDQRKEFDAFPGPILMTTNCIQKPKESYAARIFTAGTVGWPGVTHLTDRDYSQLIEAALAGPGFAEDGPGQTITIGFARNAVLSVAGKVVDAVKAGAIKHFFLVGGCDGARSGRNYYTEFATSAPDDTVILTLACGKYRFNKLEFGDIGGIPRLLDIGQCNDAYSAVVIAMALADAFGTDVNGLPLSLVLSWFEQKAVVILLSLLHLGIKGIRLGPTLPAFVSPGVLNVLVEKFDIKPVTTAEADLAAILGN